MKPFSIQIDNLTAKDARFLTDVVNLFCDPAQEVDREAVRVGFRALQYTEDGHAILILSGRARLLPSPDQNAPRSLALEPRDLESQIP